MESIKLKFGIASPEDRQKRKKQLVLPNAFTLAICISMLAIGIHYNEDCKGNVSKFFFLIYAEKTSVSIHEVKKYFLRARNQRNLKSFYL